MTLTKTEKKISAFCARHAISYEWQDLRCNTRRAMIVTLTRDHHEITLKMARRLKGVHVYDWRCSAGGVWSGKVYLQDADEKARMDAILDAESERQDNWWWLYHECLSWGMDSISAAQHAESIYPTPKDLV